MRNVAGVVTSNLTMKTFHLCTAALGVAVFTASSAFALPKYATKEKKPCSYCHVSKSGGGKRTPAGDWYKSHNHTFVGWKDGGAKPPRKP